MSDVNLLEKIQRLLNEEDQAFFIHTDISAIVPDGAVGYSTNDSGDVNGLKVTGVPRGNMVAFLDIVVSLRNLERLVIYSGHHWDIPAEIGDLSKLKYMSLTGVRTIPAELLKINLPFFPNQYDDRARFFSQNEKKISVQLERFKALNPNIKINLSVHELLNGEPTAEIALHIFTEARLFCSVTEKSRQKILNQPGMYINTADLVDPPSEIAEQGIDALVQYFRNKQKQGVEKLYEAKIVIVGAGESGKTTLIRKLQNPYHPVPNAQDKRTEGIRVTQYPFAGITKDGSKSIQAHIWDFGGQELYHTTHQLFLTPDTLYILLNDNRKNDTDFYYWLNIVTLRAGDNSPILMVFNAKDNAPRQIIPGEEIFSTFPNLIKQSIDVNFADVDITPIAKMKQTIESYFTGLEVLGKPFPAFWVKVRQALSQLPDEHISWTKFASICQGNGVDDVEQMQILAATLHNLGVMLHFPDVFGLSDLIILKSQWCIDAIYSALDTKDIINNSGRFNEAMLAKKWSGERFAGAHLQLLKLMQHFDLCYKIEGTNDYIAPQLLPVEEYRLPKNTSWDVVFEFDYMFMPAGLVTRLIARMSLYIKPPHVWRSGVVLEWEDGTLAEIVEHQLTHKIVIKIKGQERQRRLLDIRKCLYELQKDFRGLKFDESVACNCTDCKKGGDITMFDLKELEDDATHNDDVICRNGNRKKIPARVVLAGISYEDVPRIFISYSHKNEDLKNEFRAMISPLEKKGHWKVWDDRWLLPGDNWNNEIIKHLNEANVVVLMLTKEFFSSNFIYDIEFARAIQRHESGDALVIGVVLSACLWEETPLCRIQILPKDAIPVDRHDNRNEIWKVVANTIKETIKIRQGKIERVGGWNT